MKTKRYAIYGGTFDPIHIGHVKLAEAAVNECGLYKLIFMPAYISPFKQGSKASDGIDRCGMIETVLPLNKAFCLSEYELKKGGEASYTIETLRHFDEIMKGELCFVLGFDSVVSLEKWYMGIEIIKGYPLITCKRPDTDDTEGMKIIERYRNQYGADITVLNKEPVDASSTEIRERVRSGRSIDDLVTPGVKEYIYAHGLYRDK